MLYYARVFGIFWKCARVGERLSPYVSLCCIVMAVSISKLLFKMSNRYDMVAETSFSRSR